VVGTFSDLRCNKAELIVENVLLRHQLAVLERQAKRPQFTRLDRWLLVFMASKLATWRQTLLIVQPDTVLRWHRELFNHLWTHKSKRKGGNHALSAEVVVLIKRMATEN
jgi:putative transposase